MPEVTNPIEMNDRAAWRAWLAQHHASALEVWLLLHKKPYGGMSMNEAVEEALCFGWVDNVEKRFDEKRYALRFAPRKRNSVWSVSNIERVERLIASGQMTEAGMARVEEAKASGAWQAALERERVDLLPDDLVQALQAREGAYAAYETLSPSRKKQYLYSLQSAKRPETRQNRIRKIVNEVLGLS